MHNLGAGFPTRMTKGIPGTWSVLQSVLFYSILGWAGQYPDWWSTLPCGNNSETQARLVINSHVHYRQPLEQILHSLASVGFVEFCRVIVVIGGAGEEQGPSKVGNLTIVRRRLNAGDYTGFDTLHLYRTHVCVDSPGYFYLHDTCLFHPQFVPFFAALEFRNRSNAVLIAPRLSSNIMALGRGVVEAYGTTFGRNISKKEGWVMEKKQLVAGFFGVPEYTRPRVLVGEFITSLACVSLLFPQGRVLHQSGY